MGHLYVLKLRGGKWYVGYTDRSSVDRILEHIEHKGAKWTKAHPPLKQGYLHNFTTPNKTREDEDNYTLRLMKKHGIENVRGGKWCMVKMHKKTFRKLEGLIGKPNDNAPSKKKKTLKSKKKPTTKKKTSSYRCGICGREGHNRTQCYAKTAVDGKKMRQAKPVCSKCGRESHTAQNCYAKTTASGKKIGKSKKRKGPSKSEVAKFIDILKKRHK